MALIRDTRKRRFGRAYCTAHPLLCRPELGCLMGTWQTVETRTVRLFRDVDQKPLAVGFCFAEEWLKLGPQLLRAEA